MKNTALEKFIVNAAQCGVRVYRPSLQCVGLLDFYTGTIQRTQWAPGPPLNYTRLICSFAPLHCSSFEGYTKNIHKFHLINPIEVLKLLLTFSLLIPGCQEYLDC